MAKLYPVISRLDYDNVLYDPQDPSTPQVIALDETAAQPLLDLGVLDAATGDAPEPESKKGAKGA